MRTGNRLINGFRKQTRETIFTHLTTLAARSDIYSERLNGFKPLLTDKPNIYIYIHQTCVILLYALPIQDRSDDEDEELAILDFYQTVVNTEKILASAHIRKAVCGVLLTELPIGDTEVWEAVEGLGKIIAFDRLDNLADKQIPVSPNSDMPAAEKVMRTLEGYAQRGEHPGEEEKEPEDEFDRMLRVFLNGSSHDDNDDDNGNDEEDEDSNDYDCDDDDDDNDDEDDSDDDNPFDLPSDIIEQNGSQSVKVSILPPLPNPREELKHLVGCKDIKQHIDNMLALTKFNAMMKDAYPDVKPLEVSLHSLFLGRPGTGKTTVCKILGSLLHEAGVLSKGHVVVAERGTFMGTLWGDEERSLRQVIEKARGGVLMFDEAYLLNTSNEKDPCRIILPLLMNLLADENQRDIAVVLCGYKEPIMRLLDTNPGLQSRFPNHFEFEDFTVDELMEISRRRVGERRYHFTKGAWRRLRMLFDEAYQARDPQSWGNARFVANQLEHIYIRHAQRCARECPADKGRLLTLTQADIQPIEVARPRPRIGFR